MFYVKGKNEIIAIHEDNVLAVCPECGKPHMIDPEHMVVDGSLDLYGTTVYCEECSEKMKAGDREECGNLHGFHQENDTESARKRRVKK